MENKWIRGAIPALLIHCSIGTVYCWSLLRNDICDSLMCSSHTIEWAFSLAIFFLGMSAAFGGNLVEKNVKLSAVVSALCFFGGMIGAGLSIASGSVVGLLMCYGVLMGIGLGVGYLTPVKTLMMWFASHKGLATGIAITGFGLAKVIASPIILYLLTHTSVECTFYILGSVYFVLMLIGAWCIKKPNGSESLKGQTFNFRTALQFIVNKKYMAIWAVFFINITCGLALISQEKSILISCGFGPYVALISSLTACFNSAGRFVYSTASDKVRDRSVIYSIIFLSSAITICGYWVVGSLMTIVLAILLVCNAGYGGGFSTLPSLLSDNFGMKNVSVIHGFALSAWAWAGLVGNHLGNYLLSQFDLPVLFAVLCVLYCIAFFITSKYIEN